MFTIPFQQYHDFSLFYRLGFNFLAILLEYYLFSNNSAIFSKY